MWVYYNCVFVKLYSHLPIPRWIVILYLAGQGIGLLSSKVQVYYPARYRFTIQQGIGLLSSNVYVYYPARYRFTIQQGIGLLSSKE